jgi:DnaK suppressor protein
VAKKVSSKKAKTSKAKKASAAKSSRAAKKAAKNTAGRKAKTAKKASKKVVKKIAKKAAQRSPKKAGKSATRTPRKLKSPLSTKQLAGFRKMLREKRRSLVGDMSGIESEALHRNRQDIGGDLSNLPTHMADIGTDNYEQEFTLGLLESERELLEQIDEALQRIENKTYGICPGTGKPIGLARLRACPWARYCIDYARQLEKGLVHVEEQREAEIAGLPLPEDEGEGDQSEEAEIDDEDSEE